MALQIKKALVTGAAGFIGSSLVDRLLAMGVQVSGLDNFSTGQERFLEGALKHPAFKLFRGDLLDGKTLSAAVEGCDFVFHFAANADVRFGLEHPDRDLQQNTVATFNVLEAARKAGAKGIAFSSTGSVYGEPVVLPTDEEHPLRPVSYYGVSKLAGERYVDVFHRLYGMDTTILRYFHVYGPRQESNEFGGVVSIFVRNILEGKPLAIFGHGHQERSFTWVKDLVRANLAAATRSESAGRVYNAASGIRVTILELAERMKAMMDADVPIVHQAPLVGDIMHFDVSNERIRRELGIAFERDFWGTLQRSLEEFVGHLRGAVLR